MANILIIDDEPDICEILQTFLEENGYTVQIATSSESVLEDVKQAPPDLILLDVVMPGKSGFDLLPHLKTIAPNTFIVVITGVNDYRIADLFYESGINGFLTKPIRLDNLRLTINRLLAPPVTPA
ncbi:MAG: response regulator [bacterium]|nr:response regulator [bacterium]